MRAAITRWCNDCGVCLIEPWGPTWFEGDRPLPHHVGRFGVKCSGSATADGPTMHYEGAPKFTTAGWKIEPTFDPSVVRP